MIAHDTKKFKSEDTAITLFKKIDFFNMRKSLVKKSGLAKMEIGYFWFLFVQN